MKRGVIFKEWITALDLGGNYPTFKQAQQEAIRKIKSWAYEYYFKITITQHLRGLIIELSNHDQNLRYLLAIKKSQGGYTPELKNI